MQQTLTVAVGANLVGASLPDGSPAYALAIDNPSGNWLDIYPGGGTCPPYTQGFVAAFPGGAPAVDVRVTATGPAAQVSTAAGDPLTVTLYDEHTAPPASTGSPFTTDFGNVRTVQDNETWQLFGSPIVTIIPGVAGKRIRIWSIDVAIQVGNGGLDLTATSPVILAVATLFVTLNQSSPMHSFVFPKGYDMPIGVGVTWTGNTNWQTELCSLFASYEII